MECKLVGQIIDKRYKVIREIGRGGMGIVFEARHTVIGRRFAIKVMNSRCSSMTDRARFLFEAQVAGAINSHHIVPVLDFGFVDSGEPYYVMNYVDGETLDSFIFRCYPFPYKFAVEICLQILTALEVIHGAGLIHRDIKPQNIMVQRARRPRYFCQLLDFGISQAIKPVWRRPDLTQVNEILGTPAYVSPEQEQGLPPDPRWDLWAVGIILGELLSGEAPIRIDFQNEDHLAFRCNRISSLRNKIRGIPDWLFDIMDRVHHPTLERRFSTATEFIHALVNQRAFSKREAEANLRTRLFVRVNMKTIAPEILDRLGLNKEELANCKTRQIGADSKNNLKTHTPQRHLLADSNSEFFTRYWEKKGVAS